MVNFDNSYARLPENFFQKIEPAHVPRAQLIKFNEDLAADLGLSDLSEQEITDFFSGNKIPEGAEPLAQAYAGHQFGNFVPQLGDGRAILLGEVIDTNGERRDIQLKGSGRTDFSRGGDGKAWLGPVLREYLVSEAMYHLGIPTTRSLAAVSTGEFIYREGELPGAVLTRVASSHIRVGTFEYFASRQDNESLKALADYTMKRHYPEAKTYTELFEAFGKRQIELVAKWMSIGFIHGVMNTDNTSVSGETIDYGPCAFMDFFHAKQVFSSIDHYGRYAYANQANIILWNISCFANTLIPIIDTDSQKAVDACNEILMNLKDSLGKEVSIKFAQKLGFVRDFDKAESLVKDLLSLMQEYKADFTLAFRYLSENLNEDSQVFFDLFDNKGSRDEELKSWLENWRLAVRSQGLSDEAIKFNMDHTNPAYIPRNHLVEMMIDKAHKDGDYSLLNELIDCLKTPCQVQAKYDKFMQPPLSKEDEYVTFCGT